MIAKNKGVDFHKEINYAYILSACQKFLLEDALKQFAGWDVDQMFCMYIRLDMWKMSLSLKDITVKNTCARHNKFDQIDYNQTFLLLCLFIWLRYTTQNALQDK